MVAKDLMYDYDNWPKETKLYMWMNGVCIIRSLGMGDRAQRAL